MAVARGKAGGLGCTAYILGVVDGMRALPDLHLYCLPDHMLSGDVEDVVTVYLRDNPQKRNAAAATMVAAALIQAFPCKDH